MSELQVLSFDMYGTLADTGRDGRGVPFKGGFSGTALATILTVNDHMPQGEYGGVAPIM